MSDSRGLRDLAGIGGAMLGDFQMLGIRSVSQLATCNGDELYARLCVLTGRQHDICVLDVFRCAVAQARDPNLPEEQRQWWWSRKRRAAQLSQRVGP